MSADTPTTVLDRLVEHLRAKGAPIEGQERPAAILWTDPKAEWRPIVSQLKSHLAELLVLGPYEPNTHTGPAIWIRCLVDRSLVTPHLPEDRPPVIYLPEVARQALRAGEDCPEQIKPLVELMFRGTMWLHPGGTDWGAMTFLTSPKGLGLSVARDASTAEALLRALPEVLLTPVSQLEGRTLRDDDFDRMLTADVIRDVLRWMCDPAGTRARMGQNGWAAFRSRCRDDLGLDPETDTDVDAARLLAKGEDAWEAVWERFAESPGSYRELVALMRRSRPSGRLAFDSERWPDLNDQAETELRTALTRLASFAPSEMRSALAKLETEHRHRRASVWRKLGLSPIAEALAPLARLAEITAVAVGGSRPDEAARTYAEFGWVADASAWQAIASTRVADEHLVGMVVRGLLGPWLDDSARAFQAAVMREPLPTAGQQPPIVAGDDGCIVFVDGLRFDLARILTERLDGRGCRATLSRRWAATPTVTATAKPAATPVADKMVGDHLASDFGPRFQPDSRTVNAESLRASIRERGYQVLGDGLFDAPASNAARGWVEAGNIDDLGHQLGAKLARQLDQEIDRLAELVIALLDAGWKSVRIVTDHGWLLMPGGLPKVDLPKHLTESRWSRCAVTSGTSKPPVPVAPWFWNAREHFATAPGAACFKQSEEYAHGGLSIQECLVPDITVERAGGAMTVATIATVTWRGLRCFVEATVRGGEVLADLRLGRATGTSVAAAAKQVEADGSVSLVLADDEHEDAALVLVLLDGAGNVLAQRPTRAGETS